MILKDYSFYKSKLGMKSFFVLALSLFGFVEGIHAQFMNIHFTNGTYLSYSLEDIKHFSFTGNELNLFFEEDMSNSWNLSIIKSYTLSDISAGNEGIIAAFESKLTIQPNPSAGDINLSFTVQKNDDFHFIVVNDRGQTVYERYLSNQKAGFHNVLWDSTDMNGKPVPNGLYFGIIKTTSSQLTGKVIIQRQ